MTLKVIAKAGTGFYSDDYETVAEYEILNLKEFYEQLEEIKKQLKEWYKNEKRMAINIGLFMKFPLDVNELILKIDDKEIARIAL